MTVTRWSMRRLSTVSAKVCRQPIEGSRNLDEIPTETPGLGFAGNENLGGEHLDDRIILVAGFSADSDDAAVRLGARRRHRYDFGGDGELITRAGRTGPGDFDS